MVTLVDTLMNQPRDLIDLTAYVETIIDFLKKDIFQYRSGKASLCDLLIEGRYPNIQNKITPAIEKEILGPIEALETTKTLVIKPLSLIHRLVNLKEKDKTLTPNYLKKVKKYLEQDAQTAVWGNSDNLLSKSTQLWLREKETALYVLLVERMRPHRV